MHSDHQYSNDTQVKENLVDFKYFFICLTAFYMHSEDTASAISTQVFFYFLHLQVNAAVVPNLRIATACFP
jgi:hypothetical protein